MFQHRSNFVTERKLWESIFTEDIKVSLPITPYRFFPKSQINGVFRSFIGIDNWISDIWSFHVLIESVVNANSEIFVPTKAM